MKRFVIARDIENNLAGIVNITENNGEPVKIVLTQAATLKGRVTDPDNKPIKMARVSVVHHIPHYMIIIDSYMHTGEDGQFELRTVPYAQKDFQYRLTASAYGYGEIKFGKIIVEKDMGEIIELPEFVLKPGQMTVSGVVYNEDGSVAANRFVSLSSVDFLNGQAHLYSVTDSEGKFHFEGACKGWLEIQCGYGSESDFCDIYAKGGDTVKAVMNVKHQSLQTHTTADNYVGEKIPMYEMLTKGIEAGDLENKKLLVCFWYIAEEEGKKNIKTLSKMADELERAGIFVILVNSRPYSKDYASRNIGSDLKWLIDNKVPFAQADIPVMEDILDLRRASGARFLPHMILTDESKTITHEGFDIKWLKENAL